MFTTNHAKKIQHLYWRAGFGMSPSEWREKKDWPLDRAVVELFDDAAQTKPVRTPESNLANAPEMAKEDLSQVLQRERQLVGQVHWEWLTKMADTNASALAEKMCLFWHGHFSCDIKSGAMAANYLNTIRQYALGNFKDLVLAIARDPAMIRYLNNQQNRKQRPNENFARELMELFTIGRGHYSELDVKEAARAFTGWSSNSLGEFEFRPNHHDYGQKSFMGQTDNFNGEEIIDILLGKKETAQFICRKIYRFFVSDKVDESRVSALADLFYRDYDIARLMRYILGSEWFYDPKNIGVKIKSPVELVAGLMRQLKISTETPTAVIGLLKALGQVLFHPPNVAGWPGGRTWIDNSTLMMRLNLAPTIFNADDLNYTFKTDLEETDRKRLKKLELSLDFAPLMGLSNGLDESALFDLYASFLLQPATPADREVFERFSRKENKEQFIRSMCMRLMSVPEYQMC
jgi:uncharacterized protein (DUF1800 family)